MDKTEAATRLEELAEQMYELLNEMKDTILDSGADEMTLERAKRYWMAHIDGALLNRGGWLGGSFISLADTLDELRRDDEEVEQS